MKYIDEYHDPKAIEHYVREIERVTSKDWTIMEVCGGQTHAIVKHGLDQLLPDKISLLHGPGCPVCVTSVELIDKAIEIASCEDVIFCSFGDMLRVPGSEKDLFSVRARGGDVRIVYSPLDSLKIARDNPDKEVVFFGIGFETTAPSTALTVYQAKRSGLANFSLLAAHVLIPPAIEVILSSERNNVRGFLAAGHVCAIAGYEEYETISTQYNVPIVVTGFEPLDILQGIHMVVSQLEGGRSEVTNQYSRAVKPEGNRAAQDLISETFDVVNRKWRGLGEIPNSGLALNESYMEFDAENRYGLSGSGAEESTDCISGLILQGKKKPFDCPAFGRDCTPEHPLGATMVSSEGACAAYYRYRRHGPDVLKTFGE